MGQPRSEFKSLLDTTAPEATVYGQAPGNVAMVYPVIMYEKDTEDVKRADNIPYDITDGYLVTVIESDPDTPIAKKVRQIPMCSHNRSYVAENLHHTVYTIYF